VQAAAPLPRQLSVLVPIERIDKASLAAIAYALSLSSDVTVVHRETDGIESLRIRERWRVVRDGVRLELLPPGTDLVAELAARAEDAHMVVIPTVVPRTALLYPFTNWSALRTARRLARRTDVAVVTAPFRV
jgi:hypothetical protein